MSFEMRGFDELQRKLDGLRRRAEGLEGEHAVSFDKLLPPQFMERYTKHPTIQAILDASPWKVNGPDDFAAIPDDEWDNFVRRETQFGSWREMQEKALAEYVGNELGLR